MLSVSKIVAEVCTQRPTAIAPTRSPPAGVIATAVWRSVYVSLVTTETLSLPMAGAQVLTISLPAQGSGVTGKVKNITVRVVKT
mgnify:FL=1